LRAGVVGSRSESVRRANLAAVLRSLQLVGALTRSELVDRTGLTRSAIGDLVSELAEIGLVIEEPTGSGGAPGRPSPLVRPTEHVVVLALEVLVDSVAVAAVALGGVVLVDQRMERPRSRTPVTRTLDDLTRLADGVVAALPDGTRIQGAAVAVAGLTRGSDDAVVAAPNIGWREVPLGTLLRQRLDLDDVVRVGNEANLAALAESRRGVAAGLANVVYISGEVGVGGGVIADGDPLAGGAGFAGEVGHLPVNPDGRACRCGGVGCWETEIGEGALLRRAGWPEDGGLAAIDEIVRAADAGGAEVLAALAEHGRWLGVGLAGVVNIFDPDVVVLGGLLGRLCSWLRPMMSVELDRRALPAIRERVRIEASSLGRDAPLLGAAEVAWERVLADPAAVAAV